MRAERVVVDGISITVLSIEGHQEINQHARLTLKGYVEEGAVDQVMRIAATDERIVVTAIAHDNSQTLFEGLIYSVEQEKKDGVYYLELALISETIRLAGVEKKRTYQNSSLTFGQLIQAVSDEVQLSIILEADDAQIQNFVAQYRENNWDFMMRMASNLQACMIPQVQGKGISCQIGLCKNAKEIEIQSGSIVEKNEVYMVRDMCNKGISMYAQDGISCEFKDREIYALGDKVRINDRTLYIAKMDSYYEGEELWHTYVAKSEKSLQMTTYQNAKITGASLLGTVSDVQGTKVAVNLNVDVDNKICGSRMFPFSTVYSSADGTGWYCMPEIKDTVRVYFPTEFEKDAYVISSVHVDSAEGVNARSNPKSKTFSNIQHKEIILSETGITITNNAGMSVVLDDNVGLTIESNLPIYINSEEYVEISAEQSVYVHSCGEFKLEQGEGNYLDMDEGVVTLSGDEFRLQEK